MDDEVADNEFVLEDFFDETHKGVIARLYDRGYTVYPTCVGGLYDDVREQRHCFRLESATKGSLIVEIHSCIDNHNSSNKSPCETCWTRKSCDGNMRCPSLIEHIESLPVHRVGGRVARKPCKNCFYGYMSKVICSRYCPRIRAVQEETSQVVHELRDIGDGGRRTKAGPACP